MKPKRPTRREVIEVLEEEIQTIKYSREAALHEIRCLRTAIRCVIRAKVLLLSLLFICSCSKPQQATTPRWKTSLNSQTWSLQHWNGSGGYESWNFDWCDGFTMVDAKTMPICLTGTLGMPTGYKVGHRWVPRYWHSGYKSLPVVSNITGGETGPLTVVSAVYMVDITNASMTNAVSPPTPGPGGSWGGMMDPYDNQFYPHPKPRTKVEDEK